MTKQQQRNKDIGYLWVKWEISLTVANNSFLPSPNIPTQEGTGKVSVRIKANREKGLALIQFFYFSTGLTLFLRIVRQWMIITKT